MQVQKPARYSGGELGSIVKDRAALRPASPSASGFYEVGMSHLGMKILYEAINRRDDYACERVFAPWPDMKRSCAKTACRSSPLRQEARSANSTDRFTLQYEMSYTNILNMLRLRASPCAARTERRTCPL